MAGEASETGASTGDIRSSILSELAAEAPSETVEAASEDTEAPAEAETEEVEAKAEETDEADDGAPVDDEEDPELVSDDPKVQKGLDQVRVAEKRMRAMLDKDKASFEVERQKWQAQVDKVAEYETLAKRAKYDPAAVLRAFGLTDEDMENAGLAIYAESPAAAKDPARKAAAAARLKEREKEDKIAAAERRLADLEAKLEAQRAESQARAEAARYVDQVNTTAATKYPLVAHMLKVDADETNDKLVVEYNRLSQTLNRAPKPAEVVAAFDKRERARLTKLGIDPAVIVKPKAAANTNAVKKPGAKPAAAANTNGTARRMTDEEEREAILADLRSS